MVMSMDEFLAHAREQIAEHGCMIQTVFPTEHSPGLHFAYTVGLAQPNAFGAAKHPEIIVVGLPGPMSMQILDHFAQRIAAGETFASGQIDTTMVGEDYPVGFLEVAPGNSREHLALANRFYAGDLLTGVVPALQLIYPDDDRRWPWEPGSEVARVPLLGALP